LWENGNSCLFSSKKRSLKRFKKYSCDWSEVIFTYGKQEQFNKISDHSNIKWTFQRFAPASYPNNDMQSISVTTKFKIFHMGFHMYKKRMRLRLIYWKILPDKKETIGTNSNNHKFKKKFGQQFLCYQFISTDFNEKRKVVSKEWVFLHFVKKKYLRANFSYL
jgi:hypothetical protein